MIRAVACFLIVLASVAAAEPSNPLLGTWSRADADAAEPDPRQRLVFTQDRMFVGLADGVDLRRYEVSGSTVLAETRDRRTYRFRMSGSDHMCLVPAATVDAFAPLQSQPRCYVRRSVRFDPSLVRVDDARRRNA